MRTVKFHNNDSRLTLFADEQTYLVGTSTQHINTDKIIEFASHTISAGTFFESIGENKLTGSGRFLKANDDHYYKVAGIVENVNVGSNPKATLILFSAFTTNGPVKMEAFAKAHDVQDVYYALELNKKGELIFNDSNKKQGVYRKDISILNAGDDLVLIDDE